MTKRHSKRQTCGLFEWILRSGNHPDWVSRAAGFCTKSKGIHIAANSKENQRGLSTGRGEPKKVKFRHKRALLISAWLPLQNCHNDAEVKLIIERSNERDNESYAAVETLLYLQFVGQAAEEPQEEQREREKRKKMDLRADWVHNIHVIETAARAKRPGKIKRRRVQKAHLGEKCAREWMCWFMETSKCHSQRAERRWSEFCCTRSWFIEREAGRKSNTLNS